MVPSRRPSDVEAWRQKIAPHAVRESPQSRAARSLTFWVVQLTTIDNLDTIRPMSTTTMSFALPDALRSYIDQRVRSGQYGNTSEYLRDLIRHDQEEQAKKRLRELIEEGLQSGSGRTLTPKVAADLKTRALGSRR